MRLGFAAGVAGAVLVVGGIGAGVGFAVYETIHAPHKGTILDKSYSPGYEYYNPGSYTSVCSGSGSYRTCTQVWNPGYYTYVPPEWSFDLKDCPANDPKNCNVGWRDVDQGTYDRYTIGEYYGG